MKRIIERLKGDRFLRDSATYFTLSMVTGALNYFLHPVLARVLTLGAYGDLQALLALSGTISGFLGLFGSISVNVFANMDEHDHGDRAARLRLISELRVLMRVVVFAVIAFLCLGSVGLERFFSLGSPVSVIAIAASLALSSAIIMRNAFITGSREFATAGKAQVIGAAARLVLAAAIGAAGFGAVGALVGVVLSQALTYAYVRAKTQGRLVLDPSARVSFRPEIRRELRYGGLALVVGLSMSLLMTGDVLVVKHYFDPVTAGMYGGIAIVARIVQYVAGAMAGALQPSIRMRNDPRENRRLLFIAMGLSAGAAACALAAFVMFPRIVIGILVGPRYLALEGLLPRVSLMAFASALAGPLFSYAIALRDRAAGYIGAAGAFGVFAWCAADHPTLEAVVAHFTWGLAAIIIAFVLRGIFAKRRTQSYV